MTKTYPPSAELAASAHIDAAGYTKMYADSIADPVTFWGEQRTPRPGDGPRVARPAIVCAIGHLTVGEYLRERWEGVEIIHLV